MGALVYEEQIIVRLEDIHGTPLLTSGSQVRDVPSRTTNRNEQFVIGRNKLVRQNRTVRVRNPPAKLVGTLPINPLGQIVGVPTLHGSVVNNGLRTVDA
jgi:hypothetical protein